MLQKRQWRLAVTASLVGGRCFPFKKVSDGHAVKLMSGEWMKYRVTLSTSKRVSPHLHMIRFGKISHSKWILKADSR